MRIAERRRRWRRRGIHPAVVTILLIIAALAVGSLVWLFAQTQTQSLARSARIDIIDAKFLTGASPTALVTVKNTGSVSLTVNSVTIPGVACSFTAGVTIDPGETAGFTATGCPALDPGTKLTIIVQAQAATGEQVQAVGQMVVM